MLEDQIVDACAVQQPCGREAVGMCKGVRVCDRCAAALLRRGEPIIYDVPSLQQTRDVFKRLGIDCAGDPNWQARVHAKINLLPPPSRWERMRAWWRGRS